ncbi:S1 RNA-binding domain-containing protein [Sutcliffiella horikoshii]|uniref:S1 RNA-binding domain-containing protein n=1 Tax=Sutcliffiella horikoshii TaxID=79883 RepID=UPI00203FFD20|nr:S1 RNA-binding domain-containing protein [Sutcliffiella horikoshii]MCM3619727.1 S1 RNA-binding domain-containing protein [Sutcliffiella horikoshii]
MLETQTWSKEELDDLARAHRNQEIIEGIVQSVGFLNLPVQEDGKTVIKETEVAIFRLRGGVKAYCPESEFSERKFKTLNGFVGSIQNMVIERIDLDHQIAIVSVKKADKIKSETFWSNLEYLQKKEALNEEIFEGTVSGVNGKSDTIHVRVDGVDCFMLRNDWDWNRTFDISTAVDRGSKIKVKVIKFDKEQGLVRVSRKHTMEDPFSKLENLKEMEVVAGRVVEVSQIHGLFVQIEEGVVLKAIKPRSLEEPVVGDIVSCRIREIDPRRRRGKVVIVDYPRGKKKIKDLGSFLFE